MSFNFNRVFKKISVCGLPGLIIIIFLITACQTKSKSKSISSAKESEIAEDIGIEKVNRTSAQQKLFQEVQLPEVNPLELGGEIRIAGSNVLFAITQKIADRFIEEGYPQPIEIGAFKISQAFELFCQNKLDLVTTYYPMKESELPTCQQAGRQLTKFQVGQDSLAIVISSQNDFLPTDLTPEQIREIFMAKMWSDINPKWPETEVSPTLFDLNSLSTQQITNTIFNGDRDKLINLPNLQIVKDEEQLVANALTNSNVIGVISNADFYSNQDAFKVIAIDGVNPNEISKYPMVRPLYIYADVKDIKSRPEISAFLDYYLTHVNEEIENLGYFPVNQTVLNDSKAQLLKLSQ